MAIIESVSFFEITFFYKGVAQSSNDYLLRTPTVGIKKVSLRKEKLDVS